MLSFLREPTPQALTILDAALVGIARQEGEARTREQLMAALLSAVQDPVARARCEALWHGTEELPLNEAARQLAANGDAGPCGSKPVSFVYVNGINTTALEAHAEAGALTRLLEEMAGPDAVAPSVDLWLNPSRAEYAPALCPGLVVLWGLLAGNSDGLAQALSDCRTIFGRVGDAVAEALPQMFNYWLDRLDIALAQEDITRLRNRIFGRLAAFPQHRLVLIVHSQGNLLAEQALARLEPSIVAQVGVVSIGSPKAFTEQPGPASLRTTMLEGDILTRLSPLAPAPNVANELSLLLRDPGALAGDEQGWGLDFDLTIRGITLAATSWAIMAKIHDLQSSYLGKPESRAMIAQALREVSAELGVAEAWTTSPAAASPSSVLTIDPGMVVALAPYDTDVAGEGNLVAYSGFSTVTAAMDGSYEIDPASGSSGDLRETLRSGLARKRSLGSNHYAFASSAWPQVTTFAPLGLIGWGTGYGGIPTWLAFGDSSAATLTFATATGQVTLDSTSLPAPLAQCTMLTAQDLVSVDEWQTGVMATTVYNGPALRHEVWVFRRGLTGSTATTIPIPNSTLYTGAHVPVKLCYSAGKILLVVTSGSQVSAMVWDGDWGDLHPVFAANMPPATYPEVVAGEGTFCFAANSGGQIVTQFWRNGTWVSQPVTCPDETGIAPGVLAYSEASDSFAILYPQDAPGQPQKLYLRTRGSSASSAWGSSRHLETLGQYEEVLLASLQLCGTPNRSRSGWAYCWTPSVGVGLPKAKLVW